MDGVHASVLALSSEKAISVSASEHEFTVEESSAGTPVLKYLRGKLPETSWSALRKLLRARRVAVGGVVCLEEGRRVVGGEHVSVSERPLAEPPKSDDVKIRYADAQVIVVEKPAGMLTMRRGAERARPARVRYQLPTLEESVALQIARRTRAPAPRGNRTGPRGHAQRRGPLHPGRLWSVHRLDRDTSGLVVFARDENAQAVLINQFAERKAIRVYVAVVPARTPDGRWLRTGTLRSELVRDRGDGLRGSREPGELGREVRAQPSKLAVTHIRELRRLGEYVELECRLETGRTNQIRIQLAELGHPVCGDIKYRGAYGRAPITDKSRSPRLALHATELRFVHPATQEELTFHSAWPEELSSFTKQLLAGRHSK
jgi:23S rRNA pseudouridine1911/1915/1917 synthase